MSSFNLWPEASAVWSGRKPRPSVGNSVLELNTNNEGEEEKETSTRESTDEEEDYHGNVLERNESMLQARTGTRVSWKEMSGDEKVVDCENPTSPKDNVDAVKEMLGDEKVVDCENPTSPQDNVDAVKEMSGDEKVVDCENLTSPQDNLDAV